MTEQGEEGGAKAPDVERGNFLKMVGAAGLAGAAALFGGQAVAAAGEEKGNVFAASYYRISRPVPRHSA